MMEQDEKNVRWYPAAQGTAQNVVLFSDHLAAIATKDAEIMRLQQEVLKVTQETTLHFMVEWNKVCAELRHCEADFNELHSFAEEAEATLMKVKALAHNWERGSIMLPGHKEARKNCATELRRVIDGID